MEEYSHLAGLKSELLSRAIDVYEVEIAEKATLLKDAPEFQAAQRRIAELQETIGVPATLPGVVALRKSK